MQILSVGEILWDLFPEGELLGGAPLNFSVNAARLGHQAALVSAVGDDDRGRRALASIRNLGVDTQFLQQIPHLQTGVALVSTNTDGEPGFVIPRPVAFDAVEWTPEFMQRSRDLAPRWLYFGTLAQQRHSIERLTRELASQLPAVRCFYDMNLRPNSWDLALVQRLCRLASVLKLNEAEAQTLWKLVSSPLASYTPRAFCETWLDTYGLDCICLTLGSSGCFVYTRDANHTVAGFPTTIDDTVGAGDAFAAAFLHGYDQHWSLEHTARFANAAGAIVASRAGATPSWSAGECEALATSLGEP